MNIENLLETLQGASSQDPNTVKESEQKLRSFEQNPGFLPGLATIYAQVQQVNQNVRLAAAVQLKNATDKNWKPRGGISAEEKAVVKDFLLKTIPLETSSVVASQAALICSKIVRKDGNSSWGELFCCIGEIVEKDSCIESISHCALTLKELVKMMKSKRLPNDRKQFKLLSSQLWPIAGKLYQSSQMGIMESQDVKSLELNLKISHCGLKVLKSLSLNGSEEPGKCENVKSLVKTLLQQLPQIIEHFNTLHSSKMVDTEKFGKYVTIHAKILCKLSEDHPAALTVILPELLPFCAELIVNGKKRYQEIPERLIVQSMIILKIFSMKATEDIDPDQLDDRTDEIHISKISKNFFNSEALVALLRHVIMDYLIMSEADIESWKDDPEGYVNEEKNESWLYDVRPCSEVLLLSMVHHFSEQLVPVLVNIVSEVQNDFLPKVQSNPDLILTIDAVFNSIGLTSYELYEAVDFDGWFQTTLLPLLNDSNTNKYIKRRIIWLCGQWVNVKFSVEMREELYKALVILMAPSEDLVVRLESSLCLKLAIDDFSFESSQFLPFQEIACTRLFELLRDCTECDTKMRVLYIYSLILKRMRGKTITAISQLTEYLPQLWEHAEEHFLLRGAIVCSLLELTLSLASKSVTLYPLLLPVCANSVDPHLTAYIYLSTDGFDLWLSIMQTAPSSNPQILELLKVVPSVVQMGSENLKIIFQILECYMLLDFRGFLQMNFDTIMNSITQLFDDYGDECLILVAKFANTFLTSAVANGVTELPESFNNLLGALFKHFNDTPGPVLKSVMYVVAARVMLQFSYISNIILTKLNINIDKFVIQWCGDMDSVTHHDRRKLAALLFLDLLSNGTLDVNQSFGPVICCSLEILSDLGTRKETGGVADNLLLTDAEKVQLESKNNPAEPAELWIDIWRSKTQMKNLAYTLNLVEIIIKVLTQFQASGVYQTIEQTVRKQLENLLEGKTEGWGSADKEELFTKSGGEKFSTDAWH